MMPKPLYLLADSQLLFGKENGRLFSSRMREDMEPGMLGAAYIGASNGDDPESYEIFRSAMEMIELTRCRLIPVHPSPEDLQFLAEAGLVLLSGGNAETGWRTLEQNGVKAMIVRKRYEGAVLAGVSAGAVQLALGALSESSQPRKIDMFGFAPFYLGAHEERDHWWNLRALVHLSPNDVRGVGIPAGAGALYHPDGTLEPVRKACVEFCKQDGQMRENLLLPVFPT
jgi:cyanophycinase-like exopeptidase